MYAHCSFKCPGQHNGHTGSGCLSRSSKCYAHCLPFTVLASIIATLAVVAFLGPQNVMLIAPLHCPGQHNGHPGSGCLSRSSKCYAHCLPFTVLASIMATQAVVAFLGPQNVMLLNKVRKKFVSNAPQKAMLKGDILKLGS